MILSKHFDEKKNPSEHNAEDFPHSLCSYSGGKTHKDVPQGNEITNGGEATNATGFQ